MKKALILCLLLVACAPSYKNISQVNERVDKWDTYTIRESVQNGDKTIYYFFTNESGSRGYSGWYCWEYTCDNTGNILSKKEYWIGSDLAFEDFRKTKLKK